MNLELVNILEFVLLGVFFLAGMRPRSWRRPSAPARVLFRPPWPLRAFLILLAAHVVLGASVLLRYLVARLGAGHLLAFDFVYPACCGPFFLYGAFFILRLLWQADYQELEIDLGRRRYRVTRRWLLARQTRGGPLEDLAGVSVEAVQNLALSRVSLRTGGTGTLVSRFGYTLGTYRDLRQAQTEANTVGEWLGLDVTAGP